MMYGFRLIALVFALALPLVAAAQSTTTVEAPDYVTWESVAGRAEAAVDARDDPNATYETLRNRVVGFRATFDQAREANADRIATLRNQIAALGEPPADGTAEAPDIAARRAELNAQLTMLLAPVQAAQEAFTRADGLIREIDTIIRERQARRLLTLGPTPLNPASWPLAVEEFFDGLAAIAGERNVFSDARLMEQARANLPIVLLLLALGGVLVARGRPWAARMGDRLRRFGGAGTGVWSFVVSLLRIALPLAGLYAIVEGVRATGLVGLRGEAILDALPIWGAVLLGLRWLAEQLFSREDDEAILLLAAARRSEARFYITLMALLLVVRGMVELLFELHEFSTVSEAVLAFPIIVALGLILFRFGQLLRGYVAASKADEDEETPAIGIGLGRILSFVGLGAQAVAVIAPVMAGLGYATAGNALIYPTLASIGVLGLVLTLQNFASDIYGWISGQGRDARDSLITVLVSFALMIAALPVLALIWGARVADLTELWTSFLQGFQVGETRISPTNFIAFALLFTIGYVLTRLVQNTLRNSVLPKTRLDPGGQVALVSGVGYIGIFLSVIIAVTMAGIDLSALALVAGALTVGIGFGLQNIVNNFVSGIILLIERPISEGDWIEVGGQMGYVRNISVRSTRIETFDRSDVIVPNSDLISGTVTNYTRGNTVGRVIVPVGVAYGTDTRKVEAILREVAEGHPMVLANPGPAVVFQAFGASSLDFEIRAILRDVNWMLSVKSEMNHQIAQRFAEEGIEIPFPQQDVWLRNPEKLAPPADHKAEDADIDASDQGPAEDGSA